ncbi:MAG: FG-GAP-like repeat-containing protein [Candidatus Cloacimonetes bacterium]|jgi:hypothetical protein|nr:FG-GAP-like repeat-containing protein [Candidatus Cloacimonadota bacterium]MDY0337735.1 FG-GAP-like repeat-containing protein [Candidatus Cloacimonadaceae bacterium]
MRFLSLFVFISITLGALYAQPWEMDNAIFNPSGIPSMTFSQPRFNDLDGDGDFDFWLGNTNRAPLFIANTGGADAPVYQVGTDYLATIDYLASEMAVNADLNGDGVLDLITGGYSGLHFFAGNPELTFTEVPGLFSSLNDGNYPVPDLADIDADGDLDMIVGFSESGAVKLYLNTGSATAPQFSEASSSQLTDVGLYAYPVFCDFDRDDDFDILIGRDIHGFVYLQNLGTAAVADWQDNSSLFAGLGMDSYWNSGDLADINNDGLDDLLHGTADGPLRCYFNTGTSEAPLWQENTTLFGGTIDVGGASSPFFIDFDLDGDLDMLIGTQMGDVNYFENTGTLYDPAWSENSAYFAGIDHSIYLSVTAGDINADSNVDVIVGDLSGNLYLYRNNGTALVHHTPSLATVNVGGWACPRLVDMDRDGDLDLVVGNEAGNLFYYANTGSAVTPDWELQNGFFGNIDVSSNASPSFGDLDDDGDLDFVAGDMWGDLHCYLYEEGNWVPNNSIFAGIATDQNAAPALVDLDHDGDLDLVRGDYDGTLKYYRNQKYSADSLNPPQNPAYEYNETLFIHWEAPAEGSTSPFLHYLVYLDGQVLGTTMEPFWIFDSIEPGNYLFEITAEYVAGESLPASLAITVTSNEDILQPVFGLCNYPNPFNPSTTISYSVPTDGDVALSIYNARGQLVNTLVNEYKSKGRYLIAWQAKDLRGASVASGVYFLRLRSGNQSISRKILLTK